jgi:regulatory protein
MLPDMTDYNYQELYLEAKQAALNLLSRREHSIQEIEQKLARRKKLSCLDLKPLIDELVDAGWLSHARFAETFIRSRRARGQGPVKIRHELRHRGLKDEEFVMELEQYDDWDLLAIELLARKYDCAPNDSKERAKMQRFLQSRGFQFSSIEKAISNLNKADDLPQYD